MKKQKLKTFKIKENKLETLTKFLLKKDKMRLLKKEVLENLKEKDTND